MIKNTRKRP